MTILMCSSRYALLLYLLVLTSHDVMTIVHNQVDICVTQSVMCLQSLCAIYVCHNRMAHVLYAFLCKITVYAMTFEKRRRACSRFFV